MITITTTTKLLVICSLIPIVGCKSDEPQDLREQNVETTGNNTTEDSIQVRVGVGRGIILDTQLLITEIEPYDPSVLRGIIINPRNILIIGKTAGHTLLTLKTDSGQTRSYEVVISSDSLGSVVEEKSLQLFVGDEYTITRNDHIAQIKNTAPTLINTTSMSANTTLIKPHKKGMAHLFIWTKKDRIVIYYIDILEKS